MIFRRVGSTLEEGGSNSRLNALGSPANKEEVVVCDVSPPQEQTCAIPRIRTHATLSEKEARKVRKSKYSTLHLPGIA